MALLVVPLLLAVPFRRWTRSRPASIEGREILRLVDGWAASALLGVVLFGTWYNHYALPLATTRGGRTYLAAVLVGSTVWGQYILHRHLISRGDAWVLAGAVAAIQGHRNCVFVYDGYPALYEATGSCLPTTRPFPSHLQARNEEGATGIDQATEVRHIMARHTDRVVTMEPAYDEENLTAAGRSTGR